MSCKAKNCRFSLEHLTEMHQCGRCKMFGHGLNECQEQKIIDNLKIYYGESFDIISQCKINLCKNPHTHTTKGHCCLYCGTRTNYHMKKCPSLGISDTSFLTDPLSVGFDPTEIGKSQELQNHTYTHFYGGMGSAWYIRNNNGNLEYFFLHSDEFGQYGPDTSSIPCLVAFQYGYNLVQFKTH